MKRQTAQQLLSRGQMVGVSIVGIALAGGIIYGQHLTAIVCIALGLTLYLCSIGLNAVVWIAASQYRPATIAPVALDDPALPIYTVFVPLYKEANMLPSLVEAIEALQYPKDRLQVLFLLEASDDETRAELVGLDLPDYFEEVVVPDLLPRGKPKALNLGLARARGAFSVIYDAEDRPDHDQLLKAVAMFRSVPENVACLQARLFFWNGNSSWISRFYWAEYVVHFDWTLAGLAKLDLIPPLGGTSNHFRTDVLRQIAIGNAQLPTGAEGVGAWDPWNVTEDADLAGALALHGYRINLLDTVTREEAPTKMRVADPQRRRWLKGYMQTGLVYTRHPIRTSRKMGFKRWFCYVLLMIGTPVRQLINPVFWVVTIVYFATRTVVIERLFPLPVFYIGLMLMVAGNPLQLFQMVIACLKREGYGSVKYMFLTPVWWAFTSYSSYRMLIELLNPKTRSVWNKTAHGHDLHKEVWADSVPALETT